VAFAREEGGDYSIYVMDADGANPVRLGAGRQPSWSMTGDEIVYVDGTTISVVNADGSNARPIRDDGPQGFSGSPAWSPDGQRIAFLRTPMADRFGFFYLYVMDADGSNVRRVSETTILSLDGIAWSPDGERILFTGSDWELHSVRADGSDERVLTDAASEGPGQITGSSIDPAWSSDGAFIAFLRDPVARKDNEVFIMRADGTGVRQVTDDGIEASGLSWQPIPG
jgi:Tol biopolymer transport system component